VTTAIELYHFKGSPIRTAVINNQVWFCLNDVCAPLDLTNPRRVATRLDEDQKMKIPVPVTSSDTNNGSATRELTFIDKVAAYQVILGSRKPLARAMQRWAAERVRDVEDHGITTFDSDPKGLMAKEMSEDWVIRWRIEFLQVQRAQKQVEARVQALEDNFGGVDDPYVSVMGFCKRYGYQLHPSDMNALGRSAASACRARGIEIDRIPDPRFGHVGAYPESVLHEIYGRSV
jgi:prophage antirepressor-like protein